MLGVSTIVWREHRNARRGKLLPAPARRVVRARQRDRASSLPGFDRSFPPQPGEWGIDRLMLSVSGGWRTTLNDGREYFRQRLTDREPFRWFTPPVERQGSVSVQTVQSPPVTISRLAVRATGCMAQQGRLSVDITANPTRTLASLLARYGDVPEFRARIFAADAFDFFAVLAPEERLPPSLDGGDNYLPERPAARAALGPDPFVTFMPIYLAQLRDLIGRVLSEHPREMHFEHHEQVFATQQGSIRLDWSNASVPQIESYFERFHRRARAAVRSAGAAIIDGDPDSVVQLYPVRDVRPGLERNGDQFAVSSSIHLGLDSRHDLAVYAKTDTRVRFEVRRPRRGVYRNVPISESVAAMGPLDTRLLHIMFDVERHDAQRLVRWEDLFRAFDEPDSPGIGDLTAMIEEIGRATEGAPEIFRRVLNGLVVDGGISVGTDTSPLRTAINRLVKTGLLERSRIRSRRPTAQLERYRLTPEYRALHQRLTAALQAEPDRNSEE